MPQSRRSTWSPSLKKKTLTEPSSNGMGRRSSKTPVVTSFSSRSSATAKLSSTGVLRWERVSTQTYKLLQEEPMSEVQMTPDQIVEAMPQYLVPEKAGTTKATIKFD